MIGSRIHPPARCRVCDCGVSLTLVSDPGTPVYACGSTPTRIVCDAAHRYLYGLLDSNVVTPTDAELDELAPLVDALTRIVW